ncbi:MAG TPA: metallophosphoesterase family protein [Herpetosiphonaceae bacterium]
MAVLILTDIHANLSALEAVLDAAGAVDEIWCLGDTVGYGPQPNQCMEHMRKRDAVMLVGNHDLGCLGTVDLSDFNHEARVANEWNGRQLTPENREHLMSLEPMRRLDDLVTLAHGSPRDPIWEYLVYPDTASLSLEHFDTQLCFVGHTHQPVIFTAREGQDAQCERMVPNDRTVLKLKPGYRYIINPGGVGQPRDRDARAAWALFDRTARTITFRRTPYNIKRTQTLMHEAGLPEVLATRLSFGV